MEKTGKIAATAFVVAFGVTLYLDGLEYPIGACFKGLGLGLTLLASIMLVGSFFEGKKEKDNTVKVDILIEEEFEEDDPEREDIVGWCEYGFVSASIVEQYLRESGQEKTKLPEKTQFQDFITTMLIPRNYVNEDGETKVINGPDPTATAARYVLRRQIEDLEGVEFYDETAMNMLTVIVENGFEITLDEIDYLKAWFRDVIQGKEKEGTDIQFYESILEKIIYPVPLTKYHNAAGVLSHQVEYPDVDPKTPVWVIYSGDDKSEMVSFGEVDWEQVVDWQFATICTNACYYLQSTCVIPAAYRDIESQKRMIGVFTIDGRLTTYKEYCETKDGYAYAYFEDHEHFAMTKERQRLHLAEVTQHVQ